MSEVEAGIAKIVSQSNQHDYQELADHIRTEPMYISLV